MRMGLFKITSGNIPGGNFLDGRFSEENLPREILIGGNIPGGSFPIILKSMLKSLKYTW